VNGISVRRQHCDDTVRGDG